MSRNSGENDRWDQDARTSASLKGVDDNNITSDSESSVGDSLWSGSAPSSWTSNPSLCGIRSSDLYMSSLSPPNQATEQDTLFPATSNVLSTKSWTLMDGTSSGGSNTPVTPPDNSKISATHLPQITAFHSNPRKQVDYLSYDWSLEDISASWRYVSSNKKTYPKGERLEYASWRAWEKLRSNLSTVTPESLNWLKDSDDTWLYGPFKRAPRESIERGFRRQILNNQSLSTTPSSTSFPLTRPILKKSMSTDTVKENVVLLRSLSAGSLANRDVSVLQWRKTLKVINNPATPNIHASISASNQYCSLGKISPRKEHVHFKFQEEQATTPEEFDTVEAAHSQPFSRGHNGGEKFTDESSNKQMSKSKRNGSKNSMQPSLPVKIVLDNENPNKSHSSLAQTCDSSYGKGRLPHPELASPRRQNTNLFFLGDSEDDELDDYTIEQEKRYSDHGKIETSQSRAFGSDDLVSPDFLDTLPTPADPSNHEKTPNVSASERDPYWDLFHSAMSRLQAVPVFNHENSVDGDKTDTITWISTVSNDMLKSVSCRESFCELVEKKKPALPACTVSRLLSLRAQEAGEWHGDFQFGSLPSKIRLEEEDDDLVFHMGDLELPSTGADLSQLILHKRRRDWWFVNEGKTTSLLDSNQLEFMPSLTQIPPEPLQDKAPVENLLPRKSSIMIEDLNNSVSENTTKEALFATSALTKTPVIAPVYPKTNLLQPQIISIIRPGQEELNAVVENPQDTGNSTTDFEACTLKSVHAEVEDYESMTESYEDDSFESVDCDSQFEESTTIEIDDYTRGECFDSALDPMQQELINQIMDEFWIVFNQNWSKGLRQCTIESTESQDRKQSSGSAISDSSSSPLSPRKRRRQDDEPPDGGKGKGKGLGGSGNPDAGDELDETVRFACPFRKHDPHLYNVYDHSVCALSNWPSIARVKEHLYRAHRIPIHCKRCWESFKSQELLDMHLTVATSEICDLKSGVPPEGLTSEQERRLRSRKKSSSDQSNEDRWREIYEVLFPNEEIPSPYFELVQEESQMSPESRELVNYEAYMRRELPRLVRQNVQEIVRQALGPLHSSLVGDFIEIVRDAQDAVFRSYRESQGLDEESPQPPGPIPAPECSLEDEISLDTTGNIQAAGHINAMFCVPPSQSSDSILSIQMMDEIQSRSSANEMRSEPDSGYASEEMLICGCLNWCTCPSHTHITTRGAMDIAFHEYENGDIPWNEDWATYPEWNPPDSGGPSFDWQNGS